MNVPKTATNIGKFALKSYIKEVFKIFLALCLIFCGWVFADTLEQQAETPKDSVSKHAMLFNLGFLNRLEMSYVQEAVKNFGNDFTFHYGPGFGIYSYVSEEASDQYDQYSLPVFFNAHFGLRKGNFEYFFNNRLGTNIYYTYDNCVFCDIFYEPSVGIQFKKFNLSLAYNISSDLENSFVIRAGYRHYYEKKVSEASNEEADSTKKTDAKEKSSRYFRPGLELNYPIWRSKIDFFDNSFPYAALGAGLFFRIGPESIYLTTGAYARLDFLQKEYTADLSIFDINIASLPLLELRWERVFVEVPLLLSFGSGQIRFTGGALFDFYAASELNIIILEEKKIDASIIEEKFSEVFGEVPGGDMYWVLGLDIDIVRHWGIGVKYLIWNHTWSEFDIPSFFEPSHFQTRVSTYFVF